MQLGWTAAIALESVVLEPRPGTFSAVLHMVKLVFTPDLLSFVLILKTEVLVAAVKVKVCLTTTCSRPRLVDVAPESFSVHWHSLSALWFWKKITSPCL